MDLHGPKPEVAMHILGINSCLSFEHPPELDACLRTPSWSLSGEMSDQLKCKHLQLPSQNGQLFETNQERTRTKIFRSFLSERVTPSIETQNPGPLAFGESLYGEQKGPLSDVNFHNLSFADPFR